MVIYLGMNLLKPVLLFINNRIVHKESVGQFTGLCDIDGNEIYEGDILSYDFTEKVCDIKYHYKGQDVVCYFEAVGGFVTYDEDSIENGDFVQLCHIEILKRKFKVVGAGFKETIGEKVKKTKPKSIHEIVKCVNVKTEE